MLKQLLSKNSGRDPYVLAKAPDIEIEQSFTRDERFFEAVKASLKVQGIYLDNSVPNSLYLDTVDYVLLRKAGVSLRHRLKGRSSGGENFTAVFGLKYLHDEFQQNSVEILTRSSLPVLGTDNPRIRQEIERAGDYDHKKPVNWTQLPAEIRDVIGDRLGMQKRRMKKLDFLPQFRTIANPRHQCRVQFDPKDFLAGNRVLPFNQALFYPASSRPIEGLVCMEMAFDDCHFEFAQGVRQNSIIKLGEVEIITALSSVVDEQLIVGDHIFRKSLRRMDENLSKTHDNYQKMQYQPSKASLGYGQIQASASFSHLIP